MASIKYGKGEYPSLFHLIKTRLLLFSISFSMLTFFFRFLISKVALDILKKNIPLLSSIANTLIQLSYILSLIAGLSLIFVSVWTLARFLFFNNPFNRGNFKLRWNQQKMANQIQQGLIDEGIVNPRNKSYGVEVADVFPNLSEQSLSVYVEVVGATGSDLTKVEGLVNASLKNKFENLVIKDLDQDDNGRWYTFYLTDTSISQRLSPHTLNDLIPDQSHILQLMKNVRWDVSKVPHALITGGTGGGKSYFIYGLILQILLGESEIFIADPKRAELTNLKYVLPEKSVFSDTESIAELVHNLVTVMQDRQENITEQAKQHKKMGVDFTDFSIQPIYLLIDEVGALIASFDDIKKSKPFFADLKQLAMKGRSAGIILVLITQQANANTVPTDIRDQLGLRILLGNSSMQNRLMVFGDGFDYPKTKFPRGSGLYLLDGVTNTPSKIETMDLTSLSNEPLELFHEATLKKKNKERSNCGR